MSALKQIPPRLLLSRDRSLGVPLDELGHRGKVLDPRLGYAQAGIVQSYSTMIRTVSYLNSVIEDSDAFGVSEHRYAFHNMIDPELFSKDNITPELLCLHALRQKAVVQKQMLPLIEKERDSILHRKKIIEQLATRADITLLNGRPPSLHSMDPAIMSGRLTNVLSSVNKHLGGAIEETKHTPTLNKQQQALIISAYQHSDSLRPIIR